jgi:hypothetical protein
LTIAPQHFKYHHHITVQRYRGPREKKRIFKWLVLLVVSAFLPWMANASVSVMSSMTSDFEVRDIAFLIRHFSYGWEKSPLLIGLAVIGLVAAITSRGTERR